MALAWLVSVARSRSAACGCFSVSRSTSYLSGRLARLHSSRMPLPQFHRVLVLHNFDFKT